MPRPKRPRLTDAEIKRLQYEAQLPRRKGKLIPPEELPYIDDYAAGLAVKLGGAIPPAGLEALIRNRRSLLPPYANRRSRALRTLATQAENYAKRLEE
jgi:hypothetical protein